MLTEYLILAVLGKKSAKTKRIILIIRAASLSVPFLPQPRYVRFAVAFAIKLCSFLNVAATRETQQHRIVIEQAADLIAAVDCDFSALLQSRIETVI